MMQYVHIDKKWFTLVASSNGYYLSTADTQNYGDVQHKNHITKVMFLPAIACPCIIPSTGKLFDGKIGIWAFAKERPAARNSKNCPAGPWSGTRFLQTNKRYVRC